MIDTVAVIPIVTHVPPADGAREASASRPTTPRSVPPRGRLGGAAIGTLARAVLPLAAALAVLSPGEGRADAFETLGRLDQSGFLTLSENLAAATHYKSLAPAETLGVLGFDVGIELSSTETDGALFDLASAGDYGAGSVLLPRLHAHKGLPFGIDIGASIGTIPQAGMTVLGGELRLALVEGGVAMPAIALRGSYSRAQGGSDLTLENAALELSVSKGFLMFTPYAGAGFVHGKASLSGEPATLLADESFDQEKFFFGTNVNLVGFNVLAEVDRTGGYTTFSAKVGFRF